MTPPDVSVIIPVYNSVGYVGDAIQSILDQTIAPERVEMVVVDDGSTDGSDAVIARRASEDPRITVITQENSGTPGGARNPALDVARGTFVFFLDSDDLLAADALLRMVDVAHAEGSDVVLGKMASSDNRRVPVSMFKQTNLDADLVVDRVFNTLGPTKLIRREVIERLHVRFPTDQTVGEDEPFMATVYLNSRKISVLADMDYYIVQFRDDGGNMTLTKRSSASHALVALRVAHVIETYTEPGDFRDGLLRRPFDRPLARALDARWSAMSSGEQSELAEEIRNGVAHLYSDGLRTLLRSETRIKLDLLMAGELEALDTYIAFASDGADRVVEWDAGDFRLTMPEEVSRLIPREQRTASAPQITCRLEGLAVESNVIAVSASVSIPLLDGQPDGITVRARLRGAEDFEDLTVTSDDGARGAAPFFVSAEAADLPRGIWDLYVVVRFDEHEIERRLGADRSRTIEPEGVSNLHEDPAPQDRVMAYFTQGRGNLSVDRGSVLHKQLALARVRGLTLDENGRATVLVELTREPRDVDEYFCYLEGVRQHGGRRLLPAVRLGERLVGLRLPPAKEMIGAALTVDSLLGGVKTPLPLSGTEFWPARAAGFDLVPSAQGSVAVVATTDAPLTSMPSAWRPERPLQLRSGGAELWHRMSSTRAAHVVRRTPVLGTMARGVVRRSRRWNA